MERDEYVTRAAARLYARARVDGECLLSHLTPKPNGYCYVYLVNQRKALVHRVIYAHHHGGIPDGMEIDHTCGNRACIRIDHLEMVTHAENVQRSNAWSAVNARKTHCPQGHPYDAANTIVGKQATGRGDIMRRCRTCTRETQRRADRKRRQRGKRWDATSIAAQRAV